MKCDKIKEKFLDLIYDEISSEDKKKLQSHLRSCKDCKKEFMELKNTSQVLQKWEIPDPKMNLVFVKEKNSISEWIKERFHIFDFSFKKFSMAFGGAFAGILIILSLVNFEINKTDEGFSLKMGLLGREKPMVDDKVLLQEMTKVQQETLILFTKILNEREEYQKRDYQLTMAEIVRALDNKRALELNHLESALIEFYSTNSEKINQTNETLNRLISTAGYKIEK